MKILCIGDSTSLPGHTNKYEDTWFYLLKKEFKELCFISNFKRGITTDVLVNWGGGEEHNNAFPKGADCLEHYMPNIVILQLGVVDCAPRLINKKTLTWKVISHCPQFIVKQYIAYQKNHKGRNPLNVLTSLSQYEENLRKYLRRCNENNVLKVIFIGIPSPGGEMIIKNPGFKTNAEKYNKMIISLSKEFTLLTYINPLSNIENKNRIFDDGYHPNPKGNILIYNAISKILRNCIN